MTTVPTPTSASASRRGANVLTSRVRSVAAHRAGAAWGSGVARTARTARMARMAQPPPAAGRRHYRGKLRTRVVSGRTREDDDTRNQLEFGEVAATDRVSFFFFLLVFILFVLLLYLLLHIFFFFFSF